MIAQQGNSADSFHSRLILMLGHKNKQNLPTMPETLKMI